METYIVFAKSAQIFIMRKTKLEVNFKCNIPNEIYK